MPAPPELSGNAARRYELFAPALHACLHEAVEGAAADLFEDADRTRADDRRRLSFDAARALAAVRPTLRHRIEDALLRLFSDPDGLTAEWPGEVGAFTLEQLVDRLHRGHAETLEALGRRLHGRPDGGRPGVRADAGAMAAQLAGLLAAVCAAGTLPSHARNVACAHFGRRLDAVLPALAGAPAPRRTDTDRRTAPLVPAGEPLAVRSVPRPVVDGLVSAQREALEGRIPGALARRCRRAVDGSAARFDARAADRAVEALAEDDALVDALGRRGELPPPLREALARLAPVLARSHLQHGRPNARTTALVRALVDDLADLTSDARDPRHELLDDLCGDLLARYTGDEAGFAELVEGVRERLADARRRLGEIRRRARDRALMERRREAAREAADRICRRLAARDELRTFLDEAWHGALLQAHLRYGPEAAPWRRMLVLGQGLLTADRRALATLRPALADALSLAVADAPEAERVLDALAERLGAGLDPTVLPAGRPEPTDAADRSPLPDHHAWRLEDGRRRWLLVQPEEGHGQVLLSDPLARRLEWMPAAALREAIERGAARPLSAAALLRPDSPLPR
jgi:hypothetical protein